jgi:hypothetical protein
MKGVWVIMIIKRILLISIILAVLLLSACAALPTTPMPTVTITATSMPTPAPSVTAIPMQTPIILTPIPIPTPTPTPTPTTKSEPVPGAIIDVDQSLGPIVVKTCITDNNGEFSFDYPATKQVTPSLTPSSQKVTLELVITPSKDFDDQHQLPPGYTSTVSIEINAAESSHQVLVLTWNLPDPNTKANKGNFAINPKAQS